MNAFRDIDALLRMIAREKEILKFLFTGRKGPALRQKEALEDFLGGDGFGRWPGGPEGGACGSPASGPEGEDGGTGVVPPG